MSIKISDNCSKNKVGQSKSKLGARILRAEVKQPRDCRDWSFEIQSLDSRLGAERNNDLPQQSVSKVHFWE